MVITGAVGVGKTTVSYEVRLRLKSAGVSHVLIDDEFALFSPYAPDDPGGERVRSDALRALWQIYRAPKVVRVILARVVPDRETLDEIEAAIPGAEIDLYFLAAPMPVIEERIRSKQVPTAYDWCVWQASELTSHWEATPLDAKIVESGSRTPWEIAEEIVRRSGWLGNE